MITALDTDVLLDILIPNEKLFETSAIAIEGAARDGSLVVCDMVYAELCLHFAKPEECDAFLERNEIQMEHLTRDALFLAGRISRAYRAQGGQRSRILADFLIGSHAQCQASRLLSRDLRFYRKLFPSLTVVDPVA